MLGAAEFLRDWQLDFHFLGLAEVVARDLVAGVGQRLPVFLAEGEIDAGEPGLFLELALGGAELVLAGIDQALGKVPVVVGAQDEEVESAAGAAEHDHARRARWRLALHRRMLQKNRGLTAPRVTAVECSPPERPLARGGGEASDARTARQAVNQCAPRGVSNGRASAFFRRRQPSTSRVIASSTRSARCRS